MIYFKITDMTSPAGVLHEQYMFNRRHEAKKANNLREELGVESEDAIIENGDLVGFYYEDGDVRPTGLLITDRTSGGGKALVPNEKSDWGRSIAEAMDGIHFPTQAEYMEILFGATGEVLAGTELYAGVGLVCNDDCVLISCKVDVWENAKEREGFEIPEGLVEVTQSEYAELREEILSEEMSDGRREMAEEPTPPAGGAPPSKGELKSEEANKS